MNTAFLIPPITEPLGRYWEQPSVADILIDAAHAVMLFRTFEKLNEYSVTNPSGVYAGKMWRRHEGAYDPRCKPEDRRWLLCWYGMSDKGADYCTVNYREILIVD